jgi:hypothetical protein
MRRGHVDGCGRGKAIGQMQVEEFMGFEVYEPGGGTQGPGRNCGWHDTGIGRGGKG